MDGGKPFQSFLKNVAFSSKMRHWLVSDWLFAKNLHKSPKKYVQSHALLNYRDWVRDGEQENTVQQHPTLSKQSSQAIFISQLNLYGDLGWGWNFLYRNLASPDQKPVGISPSKRESSHNDARHLWGMRSSEEGNMSHWFQFLRKRYWVGIKGQNVFIRLKDIWSWPLLWC